MENKKQKIINRKEKLPNMKNNFKIFGLLMALMVLILPSFAIEMEGYWDFEEGSGSVAVDSSNNTNDIDVFVGSAGFNTTSAFGNYSFDSFQNNNYAETGTSFALNIESGVFTIAYFYNTLHDDFVSAFAIKEGAINNIFSSRTRHLIGTSNARIFYPKNTTGTLGYAYRDFAGIPTTPLGSWVHIVLVYDFNNNLIKFYQDGILYYTETADLYNINSMSSLELSVGCDNGCSYDLQGLVDELYFFDGELSQPQILSLMSNNTHIIPLTIPDNHSTSTSEFISELTIGEGDLINNVVNFNAILNETSTCSLYIDNDLIDTQENILVFDYDKILSLGEHNYFLYCSYFDYSQNTKYYEKTDRINFEVVQPSNTLINFMVTSEQDLNNYPLYVISPCLPSGATSKYYIMDDSINYYVGEVNNGITSLNVSPNTHDFCLIHGLVQTDGNNPSNNVNLNDIQNIVTLGTYDLPSNNSLSFSYALDTMDLYNVLDVTKAPQSFNTTWIAIIGSLISILIGVTIMIVGGEKGILIGGLLVLFGVGAPIGSIVLGAIF